MQARAIIVLTIVVLVCSASSPAVAASGGSLHGYVRDAQTGGGLPGANVVLAGTSMGTSTDINGQYVIQNVPPGPYTVRARYIGYEGKEVHVQIAQDANAEVSFRLTPATIEGNEVVVTGQAAGQNAAINQQLSSLQVVNVVSSAKIQELPDQNAAESVGRLPGISVLRSGGEGTEVVIRGLAPKYNQISIDGIQMSSSNPDDRSTDLSGISSNMLAGIKVFKTLTADMDANVMGGIVDFDIREAKTGESGTPHFNLQAQGGYKGLSDARNKYNNYKYIGSAEVRMLSDSVGVFAQIDIERANLSSNELGATYTNGGDNFVTYYTTAINLYDVPRDIQRRNAALVLDYRLPQGKIKFSNFLNWGSSHDQSRQVTLSIGGNSIYHTLSNTEGKGTSLINGLEYQTSLPSLQVDAKASHSYSDTKDPHDWSVEFLQSSGTGLTQFYNKGNVDPQSVAKAATYDYSNTILYLLSGSSSFAKSQTFSGSLDLKTELSISELVKADVKFGGMYRYQTRAYNRDVFDGGGLQYGGSGVVNNLILNYFNLPSSLSGKIPITYFMDPSYNYDKFLGGDYPMGTPLNYGMLSGLATMLQNNIDYIVASNGTQSYGLDALNSTTNDYSGHENQSALYVMSVITIGPDITIIPGLRYQHLRTSYTAAEGVQTRNSVSVYTHYDTTVVQRHGYCLPDISLRYRPLSWFDIRLSYSNSLAYPDYGAIIPRIDVGTSAITWNNYLLVPTRSTNYDACLSFYDNSIGLFTVGGFWKEIRDLIYPWTFYVSSAEAEQYWPASLLGTQSTSSGTYQVTTTVNNPNTIHDYGIELAWETHFWYLPDLLSGLVLSVNYSHIFSKADYPYVRIHNGRTITYVDTTFSDRLLYQPDDILNLSLGYDYQAFSLRVSLLYQDDIFTGPSFWPQLRSYTPAYRRWDLSVKQGLPWLGVELYGDIYNMNGAEELSIIQGGGVPVSRQSYGATADLGLRVNF